MAKGHGRRGGTGAALEPRAPGSSRACVSGTCLGAIAASQYARDASMVGTRSPTRCPVGTCPRSHQPSRRPSMAEPMSPDDWQAHVTTQAALAMGRWLEARGRLDRPIATLTRKDLECMASNAISRFIVLASQRRTQGPDPAEREKLDDLLMG